MRVRQGTASTIEGQPALPPLIEAKTPKADCFQRTQATQAPALPLAAMRVELDDIEKLGRGMIPDRQLTVFLALERARIDQPHRDPAETPMAALSPVFKGTLEWVHDHLVAMPKVPGAAKLAANIVREMTQPMSLRRFQLLCRAFCGLRDRVDPGLRTDFSNALSQFGVEGLPTHEKLPYEHFYLEDAIPIRAIGLVARSTKADGTWQRSSQFARHDFGHVSITASEPDAGQLHDDLTLLSPLQRLRRIKDRVKDARRVVDALNEAKRECETTGSSTDKLLTKKLWGQVKQALFELVHEGTGKPFTSAHVIALCRAEHGALPQARAWLAAHVAPRLEQRPASDPRSASIATATIDLDALSIDERASLAVAKALPAEVLDLLVHDPSLTVAAAVGTRQDLSFTQQLSLVRRAEGASLSFPLTAKLAAELQPEDFKRFSPNHASEVLPLPLALLALRHGHFGSALRVAEGDWAKLARLPEMRDRLRSNPHVPPALAARLGNLSHPAVPGTVLRARMRDPKNHTALAMNPALPGDLVDALMQKKDASINYYLAFNAPLSDEQARALAANENCATPFLTRRKPHRAALAVIARNERASPDNRVRADALLARIPVAEVPAMLLPALAERSHAPLRAEIAASAHASF